MSASHTTAQQSLVKDVEALVAALMGDAPVAELIEITNRIAAAVEYWDDIPAGAIAELRSAIDLMQGGQACATVSALLAARSELTGPPQLS
ncbi:MAG TPA: hypothetical protein VE155_04015 [Pseudonocardiaceae bacterium]|nr:hypothetical protein [Pseudonocardiaceae bacterium]